MHVKEIYVIFIHLFDSGILLIIDLRKKKGGRGAMMKLEIKTQDRTLSKNNNPGLVFY